MVSIGKKRNKVFQIAIDGPVAAGKSTVAMMVAKELGFVYVDTGAMYRAVALAVEREGVDWEDEERVSEVAERVRVRLARPVGKKNDGRPVSVYLGQEDVSWEIRTTHYGEGASVVGLYKRVRMALVKQQQEVARTNSVVMEGRDICVRVLPKAQLKIYMDADVDERTERKFQYLKERGMRTTRKKVKADLMKRDRREMTRQIDPLKPVKGAWKFDTTGLPIEEVVRRIVEKVDELK